MSEKKRVGSYTIEEIMTEDVVTLTPNTTVREAIRLFLEKNIAGAPIIDSARKVVSIISEVDLMKFAAQGKMDLPMQQLLKNLVKADKVVTVNHRENFKDVFKKFLLNPVRRVLVVDSTGKLQGLVSRKNILRTFMEVEEAEQKKK